MLVAHLVRHRRPGLEHGQVQRTDETDLAVPVGIQRIGLSTFEQAVGVAVTPDHELDRLLHLGPEPAQELGVFRHLVLAQDSQHAAAMAVVGV